MIHLIKLSVIYSHFHILQLFKSEILRVESVHMQRLLLKCGTLFAADMTRRDLLELGMEEGFISGYQSLLIKRVVVELSKELRSSVIGITDGSHLNIIIIIIKFY